jgi:hypothetical protein
VLQCVFLQPCLNSLWHMHTGPVVVPSYREAAVSGTQFYDAETKTEQNVNCILQVRIIAEFRTQTSLSEGCNVILRHDCLVLAQVSDDAVAKVWYCYVP